MGFELRETDFRYRCYYRDGKWEEGKLVEDDYIVLHESAIVFHYGQALFEGLKAYKTKDGRVLLFRPDKNWERINQSLRRLAMPEITYEMFMDAIISTVKANIHLVPEYGTGETLYIRPFVIGTSKNLGLKPSKEFLFAVFVNPVGVYFESGLSGVDFITTEYDRAAPNGTGKVKVAGNYAASMLPQQEAKKAGYAECIYLDPRTHTKIEEVGAANFYGITHDNVFVTPVSESILPSITKYSLLYIAEHILKMKVEERDCYIDNIAEFKEAGACGTAAIITPIKSITHRGKVTKFGDENETVGEVTKKLYDILLGIQFGDIEAPEGWVVEVN